MTIKTIVLMASAALLSACSAMTTISSPNAGTTVALRDKTLVLPATQSIKGTTFGNYEFKATDPASPEPMYGILPLEMKGGHMAADIILFAPGMFFNLRGAFPFYDVDVRSGVIRYKEGKDEAWVEYRPTPEEAARAREFFNAPQAGGAAAAGR